jgi:hypothetical protein
MKLFSKYLLLIATAPISFAIAIYSVSFLMVAAIALFFGTFLPILGLFSGNVGAEKVFVEFIIALSYALLSGVMASIALYFLIKFNRRIQKNIFIPWYTLLGYLGLAMIAINIGIEVSRQDQSFLTILGVESDETENNVNHLWVILVTLIPYSLLIYFYTTQRDKLAEDTSVPPITKNPVVTSGDETKN